MDKGYMAGMLLFYLHKAFNTLDHSILLMKLVASGLGNDTLFWFKSYLSNRPQLVDRVLPSHVASTRDPI